MTNPPVSHKPKHGIKRKKNLAKLKTRQKAKAIEKIEKKNDAVTFEVVFVGRSNVGKSTLLKNLTGRNVRTGKRPGVTLKPTHLYFDDFLITDMPGFGFMSGVTKEKSDDVKDNIVHYIEEHADRIMIAVQVIDGPAFVEITERWDSRDEIPIDLELHDFLEEMEIITIIAANKMDRVKDDEKDDLLNDVVGIFGYDRGEGTWKESGALVAPVSARGGDIRPLISHLKNEFHKMKRDDLFKHFK
ncbi:GTP-binding protein EngB [Methanimicrococcus hongohii]|uniref:GTP-binding protein EngB n=1 Tax=Methanimicrococcus hongohii TaxID=3028295 RepID=A0AA96UZE6_9EURY|nr:GTP-binding protein EngB [Methanimicrococcus sp. Hf6]WNY23501.1 GTP-binding protein EngB [Methanimicrococcus sp. Hf6]